jgi:hypothetical protein
VRFEALTVLLLRIQVAWDVSCSSCFETTQSLHVQGLRDLSKRREALTQRQNCVPQKIEALYTELPVPLFIPHEEASGAGSTALPISVLHLPKDINKIW